jgi:hypothetical protein
MGLANEVSRSERPMREPALFLPFAEISARDARQILEGALVLSRAVSVMPLESPSALRIVDLPAQLARVLTKMDVRGTMRLCKSDCLDLMAELLELSDIVFRCGSPIVGFALEGMQARLLEALLDGRGA